MNGAEITTAGPGAHWGRQAAAPVHFTDAIDAARTALPAAVYLEVGPGRSLTAAGRADAREDERWVATLRATATDRTVVEAIATLAAAGVAVDWRTWDAPYARRRVAIPTMPSSGSATGSTPDRSRPTPRSGGVCGLWQQVTAAGRGHARAGASIIGGLVVRQAALDARARWHMRRALEQLGVLGEPQAIADILRTGGIVARYEQLVQRWADALVAVGDLRRDGDAYAAAPDVADGTMPEMPQDEASGPLDALLQRCGTNLAYVLRGRVQPHELLFPGGSPADCGGWTWPITPPPTATASSQPSSRVSARRPTRAVICASSRSAPAPAVPPRRAAAAAGGRPLRLHRRLDVFPTRAAEPSPPTTSYVRGARRRARPGDAGLGAGGFDVVIAANVLHASARPATRTLPMRDELLAPGGMLVAYEITAHQPVFDVISASSCRRSTTRCAARRRS